MDSLCKCCPGRELGTVGDWQGLGDDFSHFDFACPAQGSYWSRAAYSSLGGAWGKDPITEQGEGSVPNGSRGAKSGI